MKKNKKNKRINKALIIVSVIILIIVVLLSIFVYLDHQSECSYFGNCITPTKCEEAYQCELKQEQTYSCHYCDGELNDDFICNGKEEIIECKTNYEMKK
jgi:flagellar basal body-associated protein FliL